MSDLKLTNNNVPVRPRPAAKQTIVDEISDEIEQVPPLQEVTPPAAKPQQETLSGVVKEIGDTVRAEVSEVLNVPGEYREISLSSIGRLGMPAKLHVRDYNGSDAQKMATMTIDNQLEVIAALMQSVIYEKIDVLQLHEEDVKEILLNIHLLFWGPELKEYFYPFTDEEFNCLPLERQHRINKGLEFPGVDISIAKIGTRPLSGNAKEPIKISRGTDTILFRIPRIGDEIYAERMVAKHFVREAEAKRRIASLIKQEQRAKFMKEDPPEIDPAEREAYYEYLQNREAMKLSIKQAQQLVAFNGVELKTIEDKTKIQEKISTQWWSQHRKVIEKDFSFGVDGMVEMVSPWTQEIVHRRVQFQPMELIPNDRLEGIDEFVVELGGE
jgi:hypothetical protein